MKKINRPYLFSVLLTLFVLIFPIISGTIAVVFHLSTFYTLVVQGASFLLAFVLAFPIAEGLGFSSQSLGFLPIHHHNHRDLWYFIPILVLELFTLLAGFKPGLNFSLILAYLFLTIAVALTEEIYFRGIIPQLLSSQGVGVAMILSSSLFSVGHFANLLAGAPTMDTLLQVLFAFCFGFVAVEIRLITDSLWIPIGWHFIHNFLSMTSVDNDGQRSMMMGAVQTLILIVYAIKLWPLANRCQKKNIHE